MVCIKDAKTKQKAESAHRAILKDYDEVMALNIEPAKLNCTQLKTVIKALKTKEDGAMSTKKAELLARVLEWSTRIPQRLPPSSDMLENVTVVDPPTEQENEDFIEAMIMLNDPNGIGDVVNV